MKPGGPTYFAIETTRDRAEQSLVSRHSMGGTADDHPDLHLPPCAGCGTTVGVVFRIDFDEPDLADLSLWNGDLVLVACEDAMCDALLPTRWAYDDPTRPVMVSELPPFDPSLPRYNYEFERLPVRLIPGSQREPDIARIGGAPSPSQRESDPVCDCGREMRFICQWTEGDWQAPRASNRDGELRNPHMQQWFACKRCRIVASETEL